MPSLAVAAPIVDPNPLQLWLAELLILLEVRQLCAIYGTKSNPDWALPLSTVVVSVDYQLDLPHNLHNLAVVVASEQLLMVVLVEVKAHRSELPLALPYQEVDLMEVVTSSHEVVGPLAVVLALYGVLELLVV